MEIFRLSISLTVGILGLVAVLLGIIAEVKRVKVGDLLISDSGICLYPTSPSMALGIVAGLVLLVAEVIANAAPGCVCCCGGLYRSSCKKAIAITCLVFSWITFIVAFSLLMAGAGQSGRHITTTDSSGNYFCSYVKPGIFAGGAVVAIPTVICAIVYYLLTSQVEKPLKGGPTRNQNIAMAQPQPYSGQP